MDLTRLLRPASIAVVGASERPGSYGTQTLVNLDAIGFDGPVFGVNPGRTEAHGRPCVPTVADLPHPVDAVVVAIPAADVAAAVEQAGAIGCGAAVVFSAGFAEVGSGVALQQELIAAAARHQLPVCGPNGNGLVNMHGRAALWGDALRPQEPGHVALVSQSGNVAVNALATRRGLRFHTVVSCGNQAVLSAADYLEELGRDGDVRSIAVYLEDDGDGARLCDALAVCAETGVRVVVLKVGATAAGAAAAAAHTGAIAGDQRVFRALVEEAGAIWAEDVHELLELAKVLGVPGARSAGRRTAILTCSGGDSSLGADEAEKLGLELPSFSSATVESLREQLPSAATVANPLDYTAMIWGDVPALSRLIQTVAADASVDQLLVFYDQPADLEGAPEESWRAVREGIEAGAAVVRLPTMVSSTLPELLDDGAAWRFAQAGVPAAAGLRTGLRCAAALAGERGDPARLRAIAGACRTAVGAHNGGGAWLAEHEAKALLRERGARVVEGRLVDGEDAALEAFDALGGEVALKLTSHALQHKSELGAIELDLRSAHEVRQAYRRLAELGAAGRAAVLIERMAPPGVEVILAARRDGVVPALVVGLGGIWTELLDDVAIVPLPARGPRVERALRSLRGAPLLTGGRGRPPVDLGALVKLAVQVGDTLLDAGLDLLELNPVLAGEWGAVAVDAAARRGATITS
jgi:acetate---CoA ligase (ADP-forming)